MTELRGKHYVETTTPCGCPARAYWSETGGQRVGGGQRYCRRHRLAFVYSIAWITLTHGPLIKELSGETADAYFITWTNLEQYRAEMAAVAAEQKRRGREAFKVEQTPGIRGERADWIEVNGVRMSYEQMNQELELQQ